MQQAPMQAINLLVLVAVVMHVLAGCGNTDGTQASSPPTFTASNHVATEHVTLRITGMSWGAWTRIVRLVLVRLDGVQNADVSFRKQQAMVTYEPKKVTVRQMIEAVQRSGFGAEAIPWVCQGARVLMVGTPQEQEGVIMTAEAFDRPGLLGRGIRVAAGLALLTFSIETLRDPTDWIRQTMPQSLGLWIGAAVCFYFLPGILDKGFQRAWGRKPQLVIVLVALIAILLNLLSYGTWWGISLGVLLFLLVVYVTMHLGVSFLLAGILAHPGWEMGVIPQVVGKIQGRETTDPAVTYRLDPPGSVGITPQKPMT